MRCSATASLCVTPGMPNADSPATRPTRGIRNVHAALKVIFVLAVALAIAAVSARAQMPSPETVDSVGQILQATGAISPGYVRFGLPRSDLHVAIGELTVPTPLALGGWVGFAGTGDSSLVMGDLVLIAPELAPVLQAMDREGIDVTAVHNHLVGETPTVTYVHFHGAGAAVDLARRLDRVLLLTGTPRPVRATPATAPGIDTALVFSALGVRGRSNGAVAQVSPILIRGTVRLHAGVVPPSLGYASPVNVAQVAPGRFVATGDFALLAEQVGPVTHALAAHGITTTALHSHLIGESPTLYYLHFWADGPPAAVLAGLRAALDAAASTAGN